MPSASTKSGIATRQRTWTPKCRSSGSPVCSGNAWPVKSAHALIGYVDDLIYVPQLRYLDEVVPHARVKFRSSNINAQFAAADAGLGLCVLPAFMTEGTRLKLVLENEIAIRRSFWISMHEDFTHVERVTVVRDWIACTTTSTTKKTKPNTAVAMSGRALAPLSSPINVSRSNMDAPVKL